MNETPSIVKVLSTVQDFSLEPTYGERKMNAGFQPDPFIISITAGGSIYANDISGYVAAAPDYRINWSGISSSLKIYFIATDPGGDATLLINSPDGRWYSNDDEDLNTLDPMIMFNNPSEGQYDIWIGGYNENEFIYGILCISER